MTSKKHLPKTPELRRWRLAEEMAEVTIELSKLERFGPNGDPDFQEWCHRNGTPRERLLRELDDLDGAIAAVRRDLLRDGMV